MKERKKDYELNKENDKGFLILSYLLERKRERKRKEREKERERERGRERESERERERERMSGREEVRV